MKNAASQNAELIAKYEEELEVRRKPGLTYWKKKSTFAPLCQHRDGFGASSVNLKTFLF